MVLQELDFKVKGDIVLTNLGKIVRLCFYPPSSELKSFEVAQQILKILNLIYVGKGS